MRGRAKSFIGLGFALGRENPKESEVGCLHGNPDHILAQGRRKEGEGKALPRGPRLSVKEEGGKGSCGAGWSRKWATRGSGPTGQNKEGREVHVAWAG